MKQTLQERFIAALQKRGEVEVKKLVGCIVMTATAHSAQTSKKFFYVGKAGSLRVGDANPHKAFMRLRNHLIDQHDDKINEEMLDLMETNLDMECDDY